jgi:hypothetical protein
VLAKDGGGEKTTAEPQQQNEGGKWKFQILADAELKLSSLKNLKVGHAWVRLLDPAAQVHSWGFWPKEPIKTFPPWKPFESTAGFVRTPDDTHSPNAVHTFDIEAPAAQKLQKSAAERVANPGSYNLFTRNCVNFAIDMCGEAGVAAPSFSTLKVANPNALRDGIAQMNAKKGEDAMEHKLPPPKIAGEGQPTS